MKTLTEQYRLIKEDKGHKDVFLKEAKQKFPNLIKNNATFNEASTILKQKNIISENFVGTPMIGNPIERKKEGFENAFANFLAEAEAKAEEKKVSKEVQEDAEKNYDYEDKKDPNNMIFGQVQMGYYCEYKDPKNEGKTDQELLEIVYKNLAKDSIYYTKNGQFGEKDLGYTDDVPSLGQTEEPKGEYKSSGYGKLKENKEPTPKVSPEKAASLVAVKAIDKLEDSKSLENIATKIAKDPKASKQLMSMLSKMNLNLNESEVDVDPMDVEKIALAFAKKAVKDNPINEEGGYDYGGAFWLGLVGGGALGNYLASMNDVITPTMKLLGHSPGHMGAAIAGAIGGAALLIIGKLIYDKSKKSVNEHSISLAGGIVTGTGFSHMNYMDYFDLNEESIEDIKAKSDATDELIDKTKELKKELTSENRKFASEEKAEALLTAAEEYLKEVDTIDDVIYFIEANLETQESDI